MTKPFALTQNLLLPMSVVGLFVMHYEDKQGAVTDYEQVIRLDPKRASGYPNRGNTHSALGNKQGAIADLQKAAALLKNQGDENNYQIVLKNLQEIINGR